MKAFLSLNLKISLINLFKLIDAKSRKFTALIIFIIQMSLIMERICRLQKIVQALKNSCNTSDRINSIY
jgi:hypothetical protein